MNTTNFNTARFVGKMERNFSKELIISICYTIIELFGLCGNILVIWTLNRGRRRLQTNYYLLVFHLAICDVALLLIGNVFFTLQPWLEKQLRFSNLEMISCIILPPLLSCIFTTELALLVVIAMLRHRAVTEPFQPSLTSKKLGCIILLVYITPLLLHLPKFFSQQVTADTFCFNKWRSNTYFNVYNWILDLGIILIAMAFLIVLYTKMSYTMAIHRKRIKKLFSSDVTCLTKQRANNATEAAYRKNAKMIIISVIVLAQFFIAVLPIRVLGKVVASGQEEDKIHMVWMLPLYFLVSCSFNPVVYGFGDKTIREGYKIVVTNLFSCK